MVSGLWNWAKPPPGGHCSFTLLLTNCHTLFMYFLIWRVQDYRVEASQWMYSEGKEYYLAVLCFINVQT
jgi:hypothetical protein